MTEAPVQTPRERYLAGMKAGAPFGIASAILALSFGVVARESGFSALETIVMSAVVYAGSAQFAGVGIVAAGGSIGAAIGAGTLMNARFLPMGIAFGPSVPGGPLWRAIQGQAVVDSSWAMSLGPDGRFDRFFLFGHSSPQYLGWLTGTAVGALGGSLIGDPHALGLDAIFPAFFVAILYDEVRDRIGQVAALAGGAIALALVSVAPPGVPVLAASAVALAGLHPRLGRSR